MNIKNAKPGDILHFYPEDLEILVVMSGIEGIRYIELSNLQFDNNGNVITTYVSYETLGELTTSLGNVNHISETLKSI